MSYPGLNLNKAFKDQVFLNTGLTFDKKILTIKRVSKKDNTNVLVLLMFYENRMKMIIKVLGLFLYFIMDKYLCADCLCLQQSLLSSSHKLFENTTFNDISVIGIPKLLLNVICFILNNGTYTDY